MRTARPVTTGLQVRSASFEWRPTSRSPRTRSPVPDLRRGWRRGWRRGARWPQPRAGSSSLPPVLLDRLAEGHAEPARFRRRVAKVGLRLRLFLMRERLRARQADAASAFLDREHQHLHLAARRELLADVGA